jgi:hypothetical protein
MAFFGETVKVGDQMFDTNRGYGKVFQVKPSTVEVQFSTARVVYSLLGVQRGKMHRTLYWDTPYVIAPLKNAEHWVSLREKFEAVMTVLKTNY